MQQLNNEFKLEKLRKYSHMLLCTDRSTHSSFPIGLTLRNSKFLDMSLEPKFRRLVVTIISLFKANITKVVQVRLFWRIVEIVDFLLVYTSNRRPATTNRGLAITVSTIQV